MSKSFHGLVRVPALVALLVFSLSGCAMLNQGVAMTESVVTPTTIGRAGQVDADDLAEAMLRAGFSREFILENGSAVRNALATSGGAQIIGNERVEAIFAIHSESLYVTSRLRGTFIHKLNRAEGRQFEE